MSSSAVYKNKLLSADTWMMQPWDVELTDDSNRAEQRRKRRRRFKKRNIAEKVNGTCKQVPTVNKDFSCCETTQQKVYYQASIVNTYVWRIAATKPWVHRTDNLNIGPCMDISATL
ncbi:hypothetical protein DPMN_192746 [Dreissena polymorpha]|uniref:Uncharacterized protein n=1 Tax=Dreissena polymorpha TaxID=45954 RepID=A0A9D4B6C3_DREPO|nr:hypothetical protein DPMN_192746 [Dreissena polymorpha]